MLFWWLFLLLVTTSATMANGLDQTLLTFVQNAIPEGGIVFRGEVQSHEAAYELFVLQQEAQGGVLVITGGCPDPSAKPFQVLFADTSFDSALTQSLIPPEVLSQFLALLGIARSSSNQSTTAAQSDDVYPIGAALNAVLGPIAGFTFRSNSTLGILQELEQSDAIPVSPAAAPAGSILVCPTAYSPTGPVSLGSAVILGSDHKVYGPDIRKGAAWTCLGLLETWIEAYGAKNQLFGFLLRARPAQASR
jgi:hypothetical protein